MSERRLPTTSDRMAAWMREVDDKLYKLENGGAITGRVSFGNVIVIGTVEIKVVPGVGTAVDLVFTNLDTGTSYTINL